MNRVMISLGLPPSLDSWDQGNQGWCLTYVCHPRIWLQSQLALIFFSSERWATNKQNFNQQVYHRHSGHRVSKPDDKKNEYIPYRRIRKADPIWAPKGSQGNKKKTD